MDCWLTLLFGNSIELASMLVIFPAFGLMLFLVVTLSIEQSQQLPLASNVSQFIYCMGLYIS